MPLSPAQRQAAYQRRAMMKRRKRRNTPTRSSMPTINIRIHNNVGGQGTVTRGGYRPSP